MSTATHATPGKLSFGGLLARIIFIILLWAGLVAGTLHYVGYVWPTEYQISLAEKAQAEEKEKGALAPTTPAAPAASTTAAAPAATSAAPASSAAPAAPTASTTAVAASPATSASTAAPAASAPKATGEQKLPFDIRLAGYNRTALENVSVFFSIVISVFCVGTIILQIFKYKHVEDEAAH